MSTDFTSALSSINPELQTGLGVAGIGSTAYNMYNQYQNQQYQNLLRSYAQDPTKMNAYAANFTQPLNAGLTSAVANNTQGYLASRGLSDSPAISQQVEAQAIAPYVQQNQQAGYQDALQALQVGGGAVNPNNQSASSIAQLAKAFSALPGLKSISPAQIAAMVTQLNAPQQTPGINYNLPAAPGPIDTSGIDTSWNSTDNSNLFPSTDVASLYPGNTGLDTSIYTPDYSADMGG
jgi:hypothetical protein